MKRLYILFFALVVGHGLFAQRGGNFILSYPISMPLGDLGDYNEKTSFRGLSMEFNKRVKSNVDVGVEIGWNVFYEKVDDRVYEKETVSISGVQHRYTNTVPMILGAKYYKATTNSKVEPFLGLGLGTLYVDRSTDFGLYRIATTTWQFCLRPEIGIHFKGNQGVGGFAAVKYYGAFGTSDLDGQSYVSLNLGLVFSPM